MHYLIDKSFKTLFQSSSQPTSKKLKSCRHFVNNCMHTCCATRCLQQRVSSVSKLENSIRDRKLLDFCQNAIDYIFYLLSSSVFAKRFALRGPSPHSLKADTVMLNLLFFLSPVKLAYTISTLNSSVNFLSACLVCNVQFTL